MNCAQIARSSAACRSAARCQEKLAGCPADHRLERVGRPWFSGRVMSSSVSIVRCDAGQPHVERLDQAAQARVGCQHAGSAARPARAGASSLPPPRSAGTAGRCAEERPAAGLRHRAEQVLLLGELLRSARRWPAVASSGVGASITARIGFGPVREGLRRTRFRAGARADPGEISLLMSVLMAKLLDRVDAVTRPQE